MNEGDSESGSGSQPRSIREGVTRIEDLDLVEREIELSANVMLEILNSVTEAEKLSRDIADLEGRTDEYNRKNPLKILSDRLNLGRKELEEVEPHQRVMLGVMPHEHELLMKILENNKATREEEADTFSSGSVISGAIHAEYANAYNEANRLVMKERNK